MLFVDKKDQKGQFLIDFLSSEATSTRAAEMRIRFLNIYWPSRVKPNGTDENAGLFFPTPQDEGIDQTTYIG